MAASALIDTGVILALTDRSDKWHSACTEVFGAVGLPVFTTVAVLTETFHLNYRHLGEFRSVWTLLRSGAIEILPIANAELPQIEQLMHDYDDHAMDFADATLVHVATRESLSLILTIDHNDFETYRIGGRKKFTILPTRRQ